MSNTLRVLTLAVATALPLVACGGGGTSATPAPPAPQPSLTPTPTTATSGSQTASLFSCFGGPCPNGAGNQNAVFKTVAIAAPPTSSATQISATVTAQMQGTNTCTNSIAVVTITPPSGVAVSAGSAIGTPSDELDTGAKTYTVTYSSPTAVAGNYLLSFTAQCGPGNGTATALLNWSYKIGP